MIEELRLALGGEGTGNIVSLSRLRQVVAMSGNNIQMCSGSQEDATEFINLFLHCLPRQFIESFMFTEFVERKFWLNNQPVACPTCNSMPSPSTDERSVLELPITDSTRVFYLSELLNQYFSPKISDSGLRCSECCPHSTSCPGTDVRCTLHPFSEQRHVIKFPNHMIVQLKRYRLTESLQIVKIKTPLIASSG